jgi:hypothetical protein
MAYGMRVWDTQGNLTFDSTTDLTLFPKTEQFISGNSQVGTAGLTISYPQFQGKKIMAFMTSPFGDYFVDGPAGNNTPVPAVLSCRVAYSNGTPIVQIFSDNTIDGLTGQAVPIYDGYLVVMLTGSNQ